MNSNWKRNVVIAAVTGAVLLLGGSAYALWSQIADLGPTQIQAGNIDLRVDKDHIKMWDVSNDEINHSDDTDLPYPMARWMTSGLLVIDDGVLQIPGWKTIPGDYLAFQVPFTMDLKGDNLIAKLDISVLYWSNLIHGNEVSPIADHLASEAYVSHADGTLPDNSTPVVQYPYTGPEGYWKPTVDPIYFSTSNVAINTNEASASTPIMAPGETTWMLNVMVMNPSVEDGSDWLGGTNDSYTLADAVTLNLTQVRG
ncbi:MAG: hypothetical protein FWF25_00505 [Propionibacteriaceae bacterium]|nr:hypothetical protein [Propionibacteriaceae bacterium]